MSFWDDLKAEMERQQQPPKPPTPQEIAENMAAVSDGMDQVVELIAGHRQKLIAQGFSGEAADAMCVQFHGTMLASALAGQR